MKTLGLIKDIKLREYAEKLLKEVPDYFWTTPSSSTGKYHPPYQLGEGGLLRHTEAMCYMAADLFRTKMYDFTEREQDLALITIIFHDAFKNGYEDSGHTMSEHPLYAAHFIKHHPESCKYLAGNEITQLVNALETHMGRWNTNKENVEILRKPTTEFEKFVHLCDYLGSRRYLDMDFERAQYIFEDRYSNE